MYALHGPESLQKRLRSLIVCRRAATDVVAGQQHMHMLKPYTVCRRFLHGVSVMEIQVEAALKCLFAEKLPGVLHEGNLRYNGDK